ncbi:MAG: hypothetical protein WD894_02635 [Pirellulales bacterium]
MACVWFLRPGWRGLRGTTLRAAWCWVVLAVGGITGAELSLALSGPNAGAHAPTLRFAAAVLVFCPIMAVLGGKRPQNVAWQFIVLTLWGILALPAFEIWMRGRGETLTIDPVRSWFLMVLVVVGAVNHLPTRFGLATTHSAVGQILLLWSHLPFGGLTEWRPPIWLAMVFLLGSVWTARRAAARASHTPDSARDVVELRPWSFVWRDFRDWYGIVWSMRVMERVNASPEMHDGPLTLEWDGFVWRGESPPPDNHTEYESSSILLETAAGQSLRALMRRFVSAEWIDERLRAAD